MDVTNVMIQSQPANLAVFLSGSIWAPFQMLNSTPRHARTRDTARGLGACRVAIVHWATPNLILCGGRLTRKMSVLSRAVHKLSGTSAVASTVSDRGRVSSDWLCEQPLSCGCGPTGIRTPDLLAASHAPTCACQVSLSKLVG